MAAIVKKSVHGHDHVTLFLDCFNIGPAAFGLPLMFAAFPNQGSSMNHALTGSKTTLHPLPRVELIFVGIFKFLCPCV